MQPFMTAGRRCASLHGQLINGSNGLMQVENVALLANAKDTGFVGINLYCDDEAGIMGAQANLRASDIATCCGKPLEVGGAGLARSLLPLPVCHLLRHHPRAQQAA